MESPPSLLQQELQQSRPFATPAEEASLAILRTASLLRRALAEPLEARGLSLAQYNVLRILRGAGPEGLPTLAVRDRLIEEAPGITRLLDKLEGAGLVERLRENADRRQVFCRITDNGLSLLTELEPAVRASGHRFELGLPSLEDQHQLVRLLEQVRRGLMDYERGASARTSAAADAAKSPG